MNAEDMFKEFNRLSEAMAARNQELELEIQKVLNAVRQTQCSKDDFDALDAALHAPEKLVWKRQPDLPEPEPKIHPEERVRSLAFLRNIIAKTPDGETWGLPTTGQRYLIDQKAKAFVLVRDTDHEKSSDWHGKTKVFLKELGWRMIDGRDKTFTFMTQFGNWRINMVSFLVDTQENPLTPGQNFPPGCRGHECVAMCAGKGAAIRLGQRTGYALAAHIPLLTGKAQKSDSDQYGPGKSVASSSTLLDGDNSLN